MRNKTKIPGIQVKVTLCHIDDCPIRDIEVQTGDIENEIEASVSELIELSTFNTKNFIENFAKCITIAGDALRTEFEKNMTFFKKLHETEKSADKE